MIADFNVIIFHRIASLNDSRQAERMLRKERSKGKLQRTQHWIIPTCLGSLVDKGGTPRLPVSFTSFLTSHLKYILAVWLQVEF
jgi:hypothetical protein